MLFGRSQPAPTSRPCTPQFSRDGVPSKSALKLSTAKGNTINKGLKNDAYLTHLAAQHYRRNAIEAPKKTKDTSPRRPARTSTRTPVARRTGSNSSLKVKQSHSDPKPKRRSHFTPYLISLLSKTWSTYWSDAHHLDGYDTTSFFSPPSQLVPVPTSGMATCDGHGS